MDKWSQNGPKIDAKIDLNVKMWFFEKYCFSLGKPYFLRIQGFKIQSKIDQKSIRNSSSKSDAKMMRKLMKMDLKSSPNPMKNRSKNDAKNWSKKGLRKFWKIGERRLQKSKKIRNLRSWGRPVAIFGAGLAECADPAEALELGKI